MRGELTAGAGRRGLLGLVMALALLAGAFAHAPGAAAAPGLQLGIYEPDYNSSNAPIQSQAFSRTQQAHADFVLIYVSWRAVAPFTPPPGFVAANPTDPAYDWSTTDTAVQNAVSHGLTPLVAFTNAPLWAEGPNRPSQDKAPLGTWDPNPQDVGDFAHALAARYSGAIPGLPVVRYWQLWAEPNLAVNLGPQFNGNTPVGFDVYRPMLNAFYANIKAVSGRNQVLTGGTAPYGNLTPANGLVYQRMQPLTFWRGLLCYSAGKRHKKHKKKKHKKAAAARSNTAPLIPQPCPNPAHFDIAAHHPINVGAPTRAALNENDISTPDLYKLKRVLQAAASSGRVVPGGNKPIWATEIWWSSSPPGSKGLSLARQARYLEQSFYVLWKQQVEAVFWFELHDLVQEGGLPIPTSGLFFRDYTSKPALTAFQFPFVSERLGRSRIRIWGEAPTAGPVDVQIAGKKGFHHFKTLSAGDNRVFVGIVRLSRKARLRAQQGSQTSLVWVQS
jgi:hypothetical protein